MTLEHDLCSFEMIWLSDADLSLPVHCSCSLAAVVLLPSMLAMFFAKFNMEKCLKLIIMIKDLRKGA